MYATVRNHSGVRRKGATCDPLLALASVRNMVVLAISGGRWARISDPSGQYCVGVCLPMTAYLRVEVVLNGRDLYDVSRVRVRKNGTEVTEWSAHDVGAEQVSEVAYLAHCEPTQMLHGIMAG